jgi:hypothetical protein
MGLATDDDLLDPPWLGGVLTAMLPTDASPLATYASWEDDSDTGLALVVAEGALYSLEVTIKEKGFGPGTELNVTCRSKPQSKVRGVALSGIVVARDDVTHLHRVPGLTATIDLVEDLPPFPNPITLPLHGDDYGGDRGAAGRAAKAVADALARSATSP